MDFERDIYMNMLDWKETLKVKKTALEIQGARQIGKTFIVQKFAAENFKQIVYINLFDQNSRFFVEQIKLKALKPEEVIKVFYSSFEDSEDTVIVIDEVQEFSQIYNMIRPIIREMKSHLIVTGSFLGKILEHGFFSPAGDLTYIKMYSLSFREFLGVFGERVLYERVDLFGNSNAEDYERLKKLYTLYSISGGYPVVIKKMLETNSLASAKTEIKELIRIFCEESRRYFTEIEDITLFEGLLLGVASLLLREKRGHLNFSKELQSLSYGVETNKKMIDRAMAWLLNSGIIEGCDCYNDCNFDQSHPNMRFYFSDLGIANYFYTKVANDNSNRVGKLAENFAYLCIKNSIKTQNIIDFEPHFGTYGKDGEIDYLYFIRCNNKRKSVAVEVKSGSDVGTTARLLCDKKKIDYLVYAKGDSYGGRNKQIFTIPLALLGRFNIFDFVKDDIKEEENSFVEFLKDLNKF